MLFRSLPAAVAAGAVLVLTARAQLTVEVVNDSGQPDANVYLLLAGSNITASNITFQDLADSQPPVTTGTPLSTTLVNTGNTVVSPLTGKTLPIYSFTVQDVTSGLLYASYGQGITYNGASAPATNQPFRFDQCELSYTTASGAGGADLTSINFLGIPMQFELFDAGSSLVARRTFYASLASIIDEFPAAVAPAIENTSGGQWNPNQTSPFADFARINGPVTLAPGGSVAPYPSFAGYLGSLVGSSFTISGTNSFPAATVNVPTDVTNPATVPVDVAAYTCTYTYTAQVTGSASAGFTITLTGTTSPAPPAPYPANATVVITLPPLSNGSTDNFDFFTYGCVLNNESFSLSPGLGSPPTNVTPTTYFNSLAPNSIYGNVVGDVLAALNFGYPGGRYPQNGAVWFANFPQAFPYGAARTNPADGYFNPYAAVLYNVSDSYGFAFSDRNGRPSPLVSLTSGQTLRVTILPDAFLNAPVVSVGTPTANSLPVSWPAVSVDGFTTTSYQVTTLPNVPANGVNGVITVPATTGTVSLTIPNLAPGTPYEITVQALGTNTANNAAVTSPVQPVTGVTAGTTPTASGSIPITFGFNTAATAAVTFSVGGSAPVAVNTSTVVVNTTPGQDNAYVLSVFDAQGDAIFQSNYFLDIAAGSTASAITFTETPYLLGNGDALTFASNQQPAPPVLGPWNNSLVIGTPFNPELVKQIVEPVVFAAASPTPNPRPAVPAAPRIRGRVPRVTDAAFVRVRGIIPGFRSGDRVRHRIGGSNRVTFASGARNWSARPRLKRGRNVIAFETLRPGVGPSTATRVTVRRR